MRKKLRIGLTAGVLMLALSPALRLSADPGPGKGDDDKRNSKKGIRHVLLISIDGMHAVDLRKLRERPTLARHLAALGKTGVNYTRTTTSRPSDSFPGLMALVTGGTPKTVGAFYDVAYDRVLAPPEVDDRQRSGGGNCNAGMINGTQTEYEEGVEIDQIARSMAAAPTPPSTAAYHPSIPTSWCAIRSMAATPFTPGISSVRIPFTA